MKFSTEELLLAAAVRDRVNEMRKNRSMEIPDEELDAFYAKPADDFVKEALAELEGLASFIARHREEK